MNMSAVGLTLIIYKADAGIVSSVVLRVLNPRLLIVIVKYADRVPIGTN